MGTIALAVEEFVAADPAVVFGRFGRDSGAGWLFGAACDRVAVGEPVTLRAPIAGGPPVDVLGRSASSADRAPSRSPTISPGGAPVRLGRAVRLGGGERGHARRRGGQRGGRGRRQAGGPAGGRRRHRPRYRGAGGATAGPGRLPDDLPDDDVGDLPRRVDRADRPRGARRAHQHERGRRRVPAADPAGRAAREPARGGGGTGHAGGRRASLVPGGQRLRVAPCGQRCGTGGAPGARRGAGRRGLRRARARDFAPLVERIAASGADVVLNTFVGADAAAFERQCHAMGLRDRTISLGPAMDEATLERVGLRAAGGIHGVSGYFQHLQTERNGTLLERYRARFGQWAPPLSSLSESMFEAIHVWAVAARRVRSTEPVPVADEIRSGRYDLPRGTLALDGRHHVEQPLHLAAARGATFGSMDDSEGRS
ncbi:hypothetical protein L7F22_069181 [Adiantum nelumboides]|nr:hypothetical protein [Adiantum nelumboides]